MFGAAPNPLKDQVKNLYWSFLFKQSLLKESCFFQIKAVYRRDQRFWARRPLTCDMVVYAAADVLALVPQIYEAMKR